METLASTAKVCNPDIADDIAGPPAEEAPTAPAMPAVVRSDDAEVDVTVTATAAFVASLVAVVTLLAADTVGGFVGDGVGA